MAVNPGLVILTGPQKTEMIVNFALTTSQVAGQPVSGTIFALGPLFAGVPAQQVPLTEVWQVVDMYINGAPVGPNGQLLFNINGYPQVVAPSIANMNLDLLTRFRLTSSIPLVPGATFAISMILATAPTAAATQSVYIPFVRSPYTG